MQLGQSPSDRKEKPRLAPGQDMTILKEPEQRNTTARLHVVPKRPAAGSSATEPTIRLTQREKSLFEAIQDDPGARKSFEFLLSKTRCSTELLTVYFVQEAWGPATVEKLQFGTASDEGKLKSFATATKRLAARMKVVNELPHWKFSIPRIGLVDDQRLDRLEDAFRDLPKLLELYARNIETKVEVIRRHRIVSRRPHGKALELVFSEEICRWLKEKTGRRYRDHVASIQRVSHKLAGRKKLPASGETLRKRDVRRKKASPIVSSS